MNMPNMPTITMPMAHGHADDGDDDMDSDYERDYYLLL